MRSFMVQKIKVALGALAVLALSGVACTPDGGEMSGVARTAGTEDRPPATPADVCAAIVSFPGWANLGSAPEADGQGRGTVWYVAIPVRNADELKALADAGIPSEFMASFPPIQDRAADGGAVEPGEKSLCWAPSAAEIEWALAPGPVLNRIMRTQAAMSSPTWEGIVVLPLPPQIANTSLSFQGAHPLSDAAAAELGF